MPMYTLKVRRGFNGWTGINSTHEVDSKNAHDMSRAENGIAIGIAEWIDGPKEEKAKPKASPRTPKDTAAEAAAATEA